LEIPIMEAQMRRVLALILIVVIFTAILACGSAQRTGGIIGGAVGAVTGGLIAGSSSRWIGTILGGAIGAAIGAGVGTLMDRASRQAAATGRPVQYMAAGGRDRVVSTPIGRDDRTGCVIVRETVYRQGQLQKTGYRQVCPQR
jgi:hypothetical protein